MPKTSGFRYVSEQQLSFVWSLRCFNFEWLPYGNQSSVKDHPFVTSLRGETKPQLVFGMRLDSARNYACWFGTSIYNTCFFFSQIYLGLHCRQSKWVHGLHTNWNQGERRSQMSQRIQDWWNPCGMSQGKGWVGLTVCWWCHREKLETWNIYIILLLYIYYYIYIYL